MTSIRVFLGLIPGTGRTESTAYNVIQGSIRTESDSETELLRVNPSAGAISILAQSRWAADKTLFRNNGILEFKFEQIRKMAYAPSASYREVFSPGQTPQANNKQDGITVLRDSQYQQPYTIRSEGHFVNREPSQYTTFSPPQTVRTQAVRHEIPVAYGRSSFVENQPQYNQYVAREEKLSASRAFPQYVPGQMPSDFLSVPLIPYLEGPHGPTISNFRPQLGSLPVPKAPLRFQPFPFQPSWTDALVEELKRDPTWDVRLSFVSRLPSEPQIDENRKSKISNTLNTNGSSRERVQPPSQGGQNTNKAGDVGATRRGVDAERAAAATSGKAAELKPTRAPNTEIVGRPDSPTPTDSSTKSPPTPRVLNPKPVANQLAGDEHQVKAAVKSAVSSEMQSHGAVPSAAGKVTAIAAKPVGASVPAGPPAPKAGAASTKVLGAGTGAAAAAGKAPAAKVKKDPASGGLAARMAEYEKAAKSS